MSRAGPTIVVIGGGFSGTAVATHLLRRGAPARVVLVNRYGPIGRGVAYGTRIEAHVLNVPAGGMSAHRGRPRPLRALGPHARRRHPRGHLRLAAALRRVPRVRPARSRAPRAPRGPPRAPGRRRARRRRAGGRRVGRGRLRGRPAHRRPRGARPRQLLPLEPGRRGRRVLRHGPLHPGSLDPRIPRRHPRRRGRADARLGPDDDGHRPGSGRARRAPSALRGLAARSAAPRPRSRKGPHLRGRVAPGPRPAAPHDRTLRPPRPRARRVARRERGRLARRRRRAARRDARAVGAARRRRARAVRAPRPALVGRAPAPGGARPPRRPIEKMLASGDLSVRAARILGYRSVANEVEVTIRPRGASAAGRVHVDRVVNCTGPSSDVRRVGDPLLEAMLGRRLLRPDPLCLGLETRRQRRAARRRRPALARPLARRSAPEGRVLGSNRGARAAPARRAPGRAPPAPGRAGPALARMPRRAPLEKVGGLGLLPAPRPRARARATSHVVGADPHEREVVPARACRKSASASS